MRHSTHPKDLAMALSLGALLAAGCAQGKDAANAASDAAPQASAGHEGRCGEGSCGDKKGKKHADKGGHESCGEGSCS
ncbi:MAG: low-complexity protein [Polyangiales bacterium]